MYRYNFEYEKTILEIMDNLVSINDTDLKMNIIITEENLLLFKNVVEQSILNIKGIREMPDYELVFKIKLSDIEYEVDEGNSILKHFNNEIILYNFDFSKVKTV